MAHVATGTNADDAVAGFRPGIRAAAERGAVTPLRDAGLTKAQVREASPALGPGHLGQAGRRLPVQPGRVRRGGDAARLARVERAEAALRAALAAPASRCATCGCATSATARPGSSSTRGARRPAAPGGGGRSTLGVRAEGFTEVGSTRGGSAPAR